MKHYAVTPVIYPPLLRIVDTMEIAKLFLYFRIRLLSRASGGRWSSPVILTPMILQPVTFASEFAI
jgi:hypothetical protein